MAEATGRHYLNGKDLFEEYGIAVSSGHAAFLAMFKKKEGLRNEWADENGTEYDDTSIAYFEDKQVSLQCHLLADDEIDFFNKFNAFYGALTNPGWQQWRVADYDRTYLVRFVSENATTKPLGRLKNAEFAVTAFTLVLTQSANSVPRVDIPIVNKAPVINLNGDNPYYINLGQPYNEPGATVTDETSGIQVQITGNVNTSVLGTYFVYYDAKDAQGLAATQKSRRVVVQNAPAPPIMVDYGWFEFDPYENVINDIALTYQGGATIADASSPIYADLKQGSDKYLVVRMPNAVTNRTQWADGILSGSTFTPDVFNVGQIPDSVFRQTIVAGAYKYIVSRVPVALNKGVNNRVRFI